MWCFWNSPYFFFSTYQVSQYLFLPSEKKMMIVSRARATRRRENRKIILLGCCFFMLCLFRKQAFDYVVMLQNVCIHFFTLFTQSSGFIRKIKIAKLESVLKWGFFRNIISSAIPAQTCREEYVVIICAWRNIRFFYIALKTCWETTRKLLKR